MDNLTDQEREALITRLQKHVDRMREQMHNSQVVIDLLKPQMDMFEQRVGHNIYAVRMSVDHESSVRTTTKFVADLESAITALATLEQSK